MSSRVFPIPHLIVLCFVAFHCAGQAPPSGGPPDTVPPTVVSTYPEQNSTDFHDKKVVIEFSEYVDRRSVEESIFISPAIRSMEYDWSGREVEIQLNEPLAENVTYVVTVGTDVIDVRNKNRMAQAFSLAFSTGATIDSASLHGKVFDAKPEGVTIFAYRLSNRLPDTLNPAVTKPDYLTQTGSDGSFTLDHLAWGSYRLYAVRDEYKNLQYEPQTDRIGMPSRDFEVSISNRMVDDIQFKLTMEDTTAPFLLDAQAVDKNTVRVRFSESLLESSVRTGAFSVVDSLEGKPLAVREFYYPTPLPSVLYLLTSDQDSSLFYRLTVTDVRDTAGNLINKTNTSIFQASPLSDTTLPKISFQFSDSARNIPYDMVFDMKMSKGIQRMSFEKGFRLVDSLSQTVPSTFVWSNSAIVQFKPRKPLLPLAWYSMKIVLDSLKDFFGSHLRDSVYTKRFQTIDSRKLGSIRGFTQDQVEKSNGKIYVFVESISDKAAIFSQQFERPGDFTFKNLPEGLYRLNAFRDADSSGMYTYGKSFPYANSERFTVHPDTIKIRARWPVEGIVLQFKKN